MSTPNRCGLAADTKVETPEGPMTIRTCAGKAIPVLTKNDGNAILFRMMLNVRKVAEQQPVVKITLETGQSFRVAPDQVLHTADAGPVAARDLRAGAGLVPAFHYPKEYHFRTDAGEEVVSAQALRVTSVEPAGAADIYAFGVNQTGRFFLTAGVLCEAESS